LHFPLKPAVLSISSHPASHALRERNTMANAKQSSSSHMLKTGKRGNPFCKVRQDHPSITRENLAQKAINALGQQQERQRGAV
jgi:hypothetical protein